MLNRLNLSSSGLSLSAVVITCSAGVLILGCSDGGPPGPADQDTGALSSTGGGGGSDLSGSGGTGSASSGGGNGSSGGGVGASGGMSGMASGGGPAGSGGAPAGSGGQNDGGGGGTASGGTTGFSTDRGTFLLGEASRCADAGFTICESFESAGPGGLPSGWMLTGYGDRTAVVTETQSARGARSLEVAIDGAQSAVVGMVKLPGLGDLGAAHFGRMFYRMEGPGVSEFVHFDVLAASGPWMDHQNEVRLASTGTGVGTGATNWSWIYNVQPFDGGGGEFGSEGDRSAHPVVDEWMCLEWEFDSNAQSATYYHDGKVIDYLVIDTEQSEIPVFDSLAVGLQKFQSTGAMKVWVDEVALDADRIGCNY